MSFCRNNIIEEYTNIFNKRGIQIIYLDDKDVIRHPIVKKVIDAYNQIEKDS